MHRVLAELFPWLVAVYILDALAWVRPGQWLFVSSWGRAFRLRRAGLRLTGVVPPVEAVSAGHSALCLTSAGVLRLPAAEGMLYEALGRLEVEGATIRAGGRRLCAAASPAAARATANLIEELRPLAPAERRALLERAALAAANVEALRELRGRHLALAAWLQAFAVALFVLLFAALPAALFAPDPWRPDVAVVLGALGAVYGTIVVLAALTLRRCGQGRRAAAGALLPLVLFPPAAVHAPSLLARDLYVAFDPLAVAGLLLAAEDFAPLARREYHHIAGARADSAGTPLAEWWELRAAAWEATLAGLGLSRDAVLAPPPRTDAAAATYCPACWTEYRRGFAVCGDCGFTLEAFEGA